MVIGIGGDNSSFSAEITKFIIGKCIKEDLEFALDYYGDTNLAVGLLEDVSCRVFPKHSEEGCLMIGKDQDTSEGNIIIDLGTEMVDMTDMIDIQDDGFEIDKINDIVMYTDKESPVMSFEEAYDFLKNLDDCIGYICFNGKTYYKTRH